MTPETAVAPDALGIEPIRHRLYTYLVGRRICLYETVPSTNGVLRKLARAGAPAGTVVLAEGQTAGRGRAGKSWFSPPGVNLYASVLFRPAIPLGAAGAFSFVAPLAVADAIRELGLAPAIKWPNDVLVKGRKVAGTLAELSGSGDRLDYVILGVGVNVNVEREALRVGLGKAAQSATSLREALGHPVDRNAFTAAVLTFLDEWLVTYRDQGAPGVLRAWRDLDIVSGRRVEVREEATVLDGRARGLDAEGRLEVEDAHGHIHRVVTGELRLLE
ncbi:MAG TPA: biotin--[acetyl-CoA-carboxylase] ligase [Methylomirabilota bacterium]|nr:biotin--[acetyl-CoA-carboxylase] ligase [Methylomirabilota bacterium]